MNKFRLAGWLAVGGLLGAALLAPAAAFATDLKDAQQGTGWDDQDFQGSARECDKLELGPGEVAWHFVLTDPDKDSGHLTATFDKAGDQTVANSDSPAAVLHFYVFTGHDTLLDAKTTDVDGNNLVLSHICVGQEEESESVPVETESGRDRARGEPAGRDRAGRIDAGRDRVRPCGERSRRVHARRDRVRTGRHPVRRVRTRNPERS